MTQPRFYLAVSLALLASACSNIPDSAYSNRGTPESLLDLSSEVVNVNVEDASGIGELSQWINQQAPTRAELTCGASTRQCARAREVLKQFGVPYKERQDGSASVALYYERLEARDCENRFVDNSINPYNLNHPSFGCSVAANMVQMVSNRKQFVAPALKDAGDGEKAVQAYRFYMTPPERGDDRDMQSQIRGSEGKGLQ